jgi:hypothetical protein
MPHPAPALMRVLTFIAVISFSKISTSALAVGVYEVTTTRFDSGLHLHHVHLPSNWTFQRTLVYYTYHSLLPPRAKHPEGNQLCFVLSP